MLSDSVKKRDYDEQLRKEESKTKSVCQRSQSYGTSQQVVHNLYTIDTDILWFHLCVFSFMINVLLFLTQMRFMVIRKEVIILTGI